MKIIRIALAAVFAAAGVLIAGPATSAAADVSANFPIQFISNYFWGEAGSQTSGTVACPSGTTVVSSGASVSDNYGGSTSLSSIAPNADFTAATAQGRIGVGGYLQVTVGCAPIAQMTEVTSQVVNLRFSGTSVLRGVVSCPAGMHAFGGGGFIAQRNFGIPSNSSFGMTANAVTADGTGWTFAATTTNYTDRLIIRTQCAPLRGGSYVHEESVPANNKQGQVYARCTEGGTLISGGVYLSQPLGTAVPVGSITFSVPASDYRWYVNGISFTGSPDRLIARVQCIY